MFQKHFTFAFRHMWRHKLYSTIKIGGFSLGIAAFLLLWIYLNNEYNYDRFYPEKDQIFRVTTRYVKEDFRGVSFPAPFAKALVQDFPEVENAGRYIAASWINQIRLPDESQYRYEQGFAYADRELIELWNLPLVSGNIALLDEPNTLLISHQKAKRYFADNNPIDQVLILNDNKPYKVVGVFEDVSKQSHLEFEFLISLKGVEFWPGEQNYWGANMYAVYTKLHPNTDVHSLNTKMSSLVQNYFLPSFIDRDFANPQEIAANMKYELQPIEEIYLNSGDIRDGLAHGDSRLLGLFIVAAILIIFIASFNFINLSVARFSLRAKEISMRKILGAGRKQVVWQFLAESLLYSSLSIAIGLILAFQFLPLLSQMLGKNLEFPFSIYNTVPLFLLASVVLGLFNGLYPSIFLAGFNVASNGFSLNRTRSNAWFQRSLVVFQFAVSVCLLICTITVYKQMKYILDTDLGFEKENVLIIKGGNNLGDKIPTFKEELLRMSGVKSVTQTDYLPTSDGIRYSDSFWEDGQAATQKGVNAQIWHVDHGYLQTLQLEILEGRNFDPAMATDSASIIISRSMADKLQESGRVDQYLTNKNKTWKIIGIVEDFHFESLKNQIEPLCMVLGDQPANLSIKLTSANTDLLMAEIENLWYQFAAGSAFRYEFLDENFANMHIEVDRSAKLFNIFAMLAILIACLGLFGLTTFNAEQRQREVGIRKVLGASVLSLFVLLSKDFLKLVILAVFIAIPIGWYIIQIWLENFAYRVEIKGLIFPLAAGFALLLAGLTMGAQIMRVVRLNPVNVIQD
ncbi:MAG: FtsX-like permease family protein [Bacteroidota bacterium]